jgi:hypothetical protein
MGCVGHVLARSLAIGWNMLLIGCSGLAMDWGGQGTDWAGHVLG